MNLIKMGNECFMSITELLEIGASDIASFDLPLVLLSVGLSLVAGVIMSLIYVYAHRHTGYEASFPITIIILPIVVSFIIVIIGNNTARAFSLAGVFALTRFRSDPKSPADISYIFATVAIGLAFGAGFLGLGVLITILIAVIMIVISLIRFGEPKEGEMRLRIVIPENMNFQDAFDDVFEEFATKWHLDRVKTADFGTMFDLTYVITFKKNVDQKSFIDELRCRNGNLTISLTASATTN